MRREHGLQIAESPHFDDTLHEQRSTVVRKVVGANEQSEEFVYDRIGGNN
jgi:hypothetical protein